MFRGLFDRRPVAQHQAMPGVDVVAGREGF